MLLMVPASSVAHNFIVLFTLTCDRDDHGDAADDSDNDDGDGDAELKVMMMMVVVVVMMMIVTMMTIITMMMLTTQVMIMTRKIMIMTGMKRMTTPTITMRRQRDRHCGSKVSITS